MMIKSISALAVAALVSSVAACGGAQGSSNGAVASKQEGTTTVKVAIIPLIDVAPLYLANKLGYFKDAGIAIETQAMQTGAATVAAVASSHADIGFEAPLPELQATLKGIPLCGVATAASGKPGSNQILVAAKSSIRKPADLKGKVIAENALKGANELYDRVALAKAGVTGPDAAKFVAVPFPDQLAALQSGQVDAIHLAEPFLSRAKAAGARVIVNSPVALALGPSPTLSSYFTSKDFATKKAKTLADFKSALAKGAEYANAHPDAVRSIVSSYTDLKVKDLQNVLLPAFTTKIDRNSYEKTADEMVQYGFVTKRPDVNAFFC